MFKAYWVWGSGFLKSYNILVLLYFIRL